MAPLEAIRSSAVRRRKAGVLVVGAAEPEVQSWLRAAGHETRAVASVDAALSALGEDPVDLVLADREPAGLDASAVCRALRDDPRLGDSWLLAIIAPPRGRMADAALDVGADDYLHRPFTRAQLLARTRTGLRAVQQRSDAALLRALLLNVPGAIYRSAWHAGHRLELISDEIERISGYPAANFIASARRTIVSIIHPTIAKRHAGSGGGCGRAGAAVGGGGSRRWRRRIRSHRPRRPGCGARRRARSLQPAGARNAGSRRSAAAGSAADTSAGPGCLVESTQGRARIRGAGAGYCPGPCRRSVRTS